MSEVDHKLPDSRQSSWHLAAIQLSGWTSIPIIATSLLVLQQNSFLGAILTIIVGNAILWFLRLGIISMTYDERKSTLEISRDYLGSFGSYFIAILLLASTFAWFIVQTTSASDALTQLITIEESPQIDKFVQMSVFLGIVSAFLCMEGITLLRKLAVLCFPILILVFIIIIITLPSPSIQETGQPLSLSGLGLILATNLGLTSDLPTFFRHSRSWQTSIKALTIIQLASLVLAICSLYFSSMLIQGFEINDQAILASGNNILRLSLIVFVLLSVICANVANVYSASVGWEIVAPKALVGRKEYLILGLGLTTIFILVSHVFSVDFLLFLTDSSLVILCVVLLSGFLMSRLFNKSPSKVDQILYFAAWASLTCLTAFREIMSPSVYLYAVGLVVILFISVFGIRVYLFKVKR